VASLEPFRIQLSEQAHEDLRERVAHTCWPSQPVGERWALGMDFAWLRELCEHWAGAYDWGGYEGRLNEVPGFRRNGIHFWHVLAKGEGLPILLIHGWPGGPIEFREAIPRLRAAGHDVVVPSLPGYAWSEDPGEPLNVTAIAERLRELMEEGLGYPRYAVQGGDWGAVIAARMAFDSPANVVALHTNTPALLPPPGELVDPPLTEAEQSFAQAAQRWPLRDGAYLLLQGTLPDTLAPGLHDSPAGLAAWLVDKYRRWSDCDGEVERRFSKDDLCDFLTMYWSTGTIASSMRLYYGERRGRWRLQPGERIEVPAGAADFPAEVLRAPREWAERTLTDLRRWTEMPRGGHFAAFEEPELFSRDLLEFLAEVRP
jgi:microsomal epoxide hydrolase